MKRKIELVCWILFTLCSGICFFINFMSKPPVDDTHKFTLYMIGAATVSLLYPGTMFILGLRNSYLYDKLNKFAKEKGETETVKSTQISKPSVSGYTVSDMKTLVSALISDKNLTEEEKEFLLEYILLSLRFMKSSNTGEVHILSRISFLKKKKIRKTILPII